MTNFTPTPAFADFDQRARKGDHLTVAFLGGSLTWGANASDPQLTSYRARTAAKLVQLYPQAHFTFRDAAIGGTGSQLAVFRLQRDVLRHGPDLVFLDFSVNDDLCATDVERLASYESLLRRILNEARCPVVVVILPVRDSVEAADLSALPRRQAHLALAQTYQLAVADAVAHVREQVRITRITPAELWPFEPVHPGDACYELYAQAALTGLQTAIREQRVGVCPPRMVYPDTYMNWARVRLSGLTPLPTGWRVGQPHRVSAYYDMLMSRWLEDVVIVTADNPAVQSLRIRFRGCTVLLFGEGTPHTGYFKIRIDGQPMRNGSDAQASDRFDAGALGRAAAGNVRLVETVATGLHPDREHHLELTPVFTTPQQELRLESICVAGPNAGVWM